MEIVVGQGQYLYPYLGEEMAVIPVLGLPCLGPGRGNLLSPGRVPLSTRGKAGFGNADPSTHLSCSKQIFILFRSFDFFSL